jgi:hypothetical protein
MTEMRSSIELAITGSEQNVRAFATHVAVKDAAVELLAPRATEAARAAMGNLWVWRTASEAIPVDVRPDDALAGFLKAHSFLIHSVSEWRDRIVDVVVTVVSEYEDAELASGYSFEAGTISMLSEFGATLEIDIVRQLS